LLVRLLVLLLVVLVLLWRVVLVFVLDFFFSSCLFIDKRPKPIHIFHIFIVLSDYDNILCETVLFL
jgi:hypothetical protein